MKVFEVDGETFTLTPPLVLFGRYGSNNHYRTFSPNAIKYQAADPAPKRAKKQKISPSYLYVSTAYGLHNDNIEQQKKWLELSKINDD